jgi:hypothetical protein
MKIMDIPRLAMPRMGIKGIPWNSHRPMKKIQARMLYHTIPCRCHSDQDTTKLPNQRQSANTVLLHLRPQHQVPRQDLARPLHNLCQQRKRDPNLSRTRSFSSYK